MKKLLKFIFILLAGTTFCIVVAVITIKLFLTPEKIKMMIEKQVASNLRREVKLGAISVGIFSGMQVSDFELSESPDFSKGTFISSEKFILHLRLLPLLTKQIIIKDIELIKPRVEIIRSPDGKTYNFSSLTSSSEEKTKADPPSELNLLISKAVITQGTLTFTDESPSKQSLSVEALDLEINNFSLTSPMNLETAFLLKVKNTESKIIFAGDVDLSGNLKIITCNLTSGASKITLAGETKALLTEHPTFDLTLGLQSFNPQLLAAFVALPATMHLSDPLNGSAGISGTKDATSLNLDIKTLDLQMGSLELKGDGSIRQSAEVATVFKLRVQSNEFPLTDLLRQIPAAKLPPEIKLSGNIQINADINGTADQGHLALKLNGSPLNFAYGDSFNKAAGTTFTMEGKGNYEGNSFQVSALTLTLARIVLNGVGAFQSGKKSNQYTLNLKSNAFALEDLAATLPPLKDYDLHGGSQVQLKISDKATKGTAILDKASLQYEESKLTQLDGTVNFSPGVVSISKLTGLINGSNLKLSANVKKTTTHLVINSDIDMAVLNLDKLIPKETTPKKTDAGGLFVKEAWAEEPSLPMNLSGVLKVAQVKHEHLSGQNLVLRWNLTDVTKDLSRINGMASLRQGSGEFKNVKSLTSGSPIAKILLLPITLLQKIDKALQGALRIPSFDDITYREISGDYSFKSGTMNIAQFFIDGTNLGAEMTGTIGLAGAQALNLKSKVNPKGSATAIPPIEFSIKGTASDPKTEINVLATGKNAIESILRSDDANKLFKGIFK